MKYRIFGNTNVVVTTTIEVPDDSEISEKELYEIAAKKFRGIKPYLGNSGSDKLIGVEGEHDSIFAEEKIVWDDFEKNPQE